MAMPKKGRRSVIIADLTFYWRLSVDKDYQYRNLHIQYSENSAAKITAQFVGTHYALTVTPDIVRQVVETALKSGWNPVSATKRLNIPMAQKLYPDAVMQPWES